MAKKSDSKSAQAVAEAPVYDPQATQQNPVLITTEFKGIFQGDLKSFDPASKTAVLTQARCCLKFWNGKGFVGLVVGGPDRNCKVTGAAPEMTLFGVTAMLKCTPESVLAWQKEPQG